MKRSFGSLAFLAAVTVAALWPGIAFGHASLLSSNPPADAYLQQSPPQISLTFAETIDHAASKIQLLNNAGQPVALGPLTFASNDEGMIVEVPKLAPGIYNVVWQNVSTVDGHPLGGSYPFTVLNPDGTVPAGANKFVARSGNDPAPLADSVAVRALSLLGLAILAGAGLLVLVLGPDEHSVRIGLERTAYFGAVVLAVATALDLPVIQSAFTNRPLSDVLFHTIPGGYWTIRLGALLLVGVAALFVREAPRRAAGGLLASVAVYLFAYTQTSHAAAAGAGSGWARIFDFAHGLSAIFWIGSVIGVAVTARLLQRHGRYGRFMPRFSTLASVLVFVLLTTGTLSALIEFDHPSKLFDTRYGLTLLVKLGLAVPLLAVAYYNMHLGRKRLARLAPGEPRRFILTATAEVTLGLCVFMAAAVLSQSTPARSVVIQPTSKAYAGTNTAADLKVTFKVSPNQTGINTFEVDLGGAPGVDINAERVRLIFRYLDNPNVGLSFLVLTRKDRGLYTGTGPYIPYKGNWEVETEIRRANVNDVTTFFPVSPTAPATAISYHGSAWANPAANLGWTRFFGWGVFIVAAGLWLFRGNIGSVSGKAGRAATGGTFLGIVVAILMIFATKPLG